MEEQNTVLECYSPKEFLEKFMTDNIALLAEANFQKGTFPFTKAPMPKNQNAISGHSLSSIQECELELLDSLYGNTDQKWIFAADSADLGLVLKDKNAEPILLAAKTPLIEFQEAYLLNQFTEESILNAINRQNNTPRQEVLKSYLVASYTENNLSELDIEIRKCRQENFLKNYSDPDIKEKTKNTIAEIKEMLALDPTEQKVFYTLHKYFAKQIGCDIAMNNLADEADFKKTLENMGSENFAKLLFHAASYTERLTHIGYSTEPIYSTSHPVLDSNKGYIAPQAASIGDNYVAKEQTVAKKQPVIERKPEHTRSNSNETRGI